MTRLIYAILLAGAALGQQTLPPRLSFEAASVKPAEQATGWLAPIETGNPARVTYRNYVLKKLIIEAYDAGRYQVEGPAWIERDRYDIVANTPRGTNSDQTRQMLQSLLAERFHLAMHAEKRDFARLCALAGQGYFETAPGKGRPEYRRLQIVRHTFGICGDVIDSLG